MANHLCRRAGHPDPYAIECVSLNHELRLESTSGLTLTAESDLKDCRGHVDTLLVPGGSNLDAMDSDPGVLHWIRAIASQARRVASVCRGAFLLAKAGLLDGRSATTHWEDVHRFASEYPEVSVCPDRIYVKDGNVYTAAGAAAGIDMALALVEEDLGKALAIDVARNLVMYVHRSGGQSQQSTLLEAQAGNHQPLRELLVWAAEHPNEDLSVERLAMRVHMSCRNFSRTFRRTVGKTPARFVETMRVDTARRLLEETDLQLDDIAVACGLGSSNSMRRSFVRVLGISPAEYRGKTREFPTRVKHRPIAAESDELLSFSKN